MSAASTTSPPCSLFLRGTATTATPFLLRRRNLLTLTSLDSLLLRSSSSTTTNPNKPLLRLSASLTDAHPLHLSWLSSPSSHDDTYGGWAVAEPPPPTPSKKKGLPTVVIGGIGACVAALLAAVAYFSLSRNGFKLPFRTAIVTPANETETKVFDENAAVTLSFREAVPEASSSQTPASERVERVKLSVVVDPSQLEALSTLKKLKIIEDDAIAGDLCTRREYARWLVRLNSLLERSSKHRIVPPTSTTIPAFDDVAVEDPDFQFIQALAEAGIIPSKLSQFSFGSNSLEGDGSFCFYPERFISRLDLVNWKSQLEYNFVPEITEQMSRVKVSYMDVKEIPRDASPELFVDLLAGEKSIFRNVFGQSRRFQPNKPLTKAQAAAALTSGRMAKAVYDELLRLEAESSSRQTAIREIRSELLDKGDIQRFWDEEMKEERARGVEIEKIYIAALHDLDQEKVIHGKTYDEYLKEKAAMDCQRQLLLSLKEEVDVMSEKLASERAMYVAEQLSLQGSLSDLLREQEEMLDSKSILEAEIEALRILRSWIEDEARRSQARTKVLEEVGRRWRWDNHD
ncbi:hypothetical protein Tsubulata_044806 [Turnera subulata]|uniref:SLH domain-containing protein n=1 Tax=Turnera subulata TaxID=218843 RepID=A0A9Q0FMQ8_9ROSI|nr:hypothetical protein Tsubulata_044806 [Turnera subulata]